MDEEIGENRNIHIVSIDTTPAPGMTVVLNYMINYLIIDVLSLIQIHFFLSLYPKFNLQIIECTFFYSNFLYFKSIST